MDAVKALESRIESLSKELQQVNELLDHLTTRREVLTETLKQLESIINDVAAGETSHESPRKRAAAAGKVRIRWSKHIQSLLTSEGPMSVSDIADRLASRLSTDLPAAKRAIAQTLYNMKKRGAVIHDEFSKQYRWSEPLRIRNGTLEGFANS